MAPSSSPVDPRPGKPGVSTPRCSVRWRFGTPPLALEQGVQRIALARVQVRAPAAARSVTYGHFGKSRLPSKRELGVRKDRSNGAVVDEHSASPQRRASQLVGHVRKRGCRAGNRRSGRAHQRPPVVDAGAPAFT